MAEPQPLESRTPDAVDAHVGREMRRIRRSRDLSQTELATAIGVTFQQVQKYEKGSNRVSASMLYRVCKALDCVPTNLFPGISASEPVASKPIYDFEGFDRLAKAVSTLSARERRAVLQLVEAMSAESPAP